MYSITIQMVMLTFLMTVQIPLRIRKGIERIERMCS